MNFARIAIYLATVGFLRAATCPTTASPPAASAWDSSGNNLLSGTYYFRYVQYTVGDQKGDLSRAVAVYNTITFDGKGSYSISGYELDSNTVAPVTSPTTTSGEFQPTAFTAAGTYSISITGFGFLTNPICPGDLIWGSVAQNGSFTGSSTETLSSYNDIFLSAPLASPEATNATLSGTYTVNYLNYPNGYPADTVAATFEINPNGAAAAGFTGSLGTVSVMSYTGNGAMAKSSQSDVSYQFNNGAAVLNFTASAVIPGQELLFISPDGNFIFGGASGAWDIFVGVRTSGPAGSGFGGLYYQAGIDEDETNLAASGIGAIDTYYGAFEPISSSGTIIDHQRIRAQLSPQSLAATSPCAMGASCAIGYTFTDPYESAFEPFNGTTPATYTSTVSQSSYTIGGGGTIRIGFGTSPHLGINVALQAPALAGPASTATAPYINPTGVLNAASYAPFTSGISPGGLMVLFGSNFSNSMAAAGAATTTLDGVQVTFNGTLAYISYVTPTQMSVTVPYSITGPAAQIVVTNSNGSSNTVWEPVNLTTPGVLTQSENGISDAIATHQSGALITAADPAAPGETVFVYLTGLGAVATPVFGTGTIVQGLNVFSATIGGMSATVTSAGAMTSIPGLYQMELTIPALASGPAVDEVLVIEGPDSKTSESKIQVGTAPAAGAQ